MAYKQYTLYGYVSTGMILVNIFHLIYVFDGQYNEKSILSTMDITTEVPFSFSNTFYCDSFRLPFFLLFLDVHLSLFTILLLLFIFILQ